MSVWYAFPPILFSAYKFPKTNLNKPNRMNLSFDYSIELCLKNVFKKETN